MTGDLLRRTGFAVLACVMIASVYETAMIADKLGRRATQRTPAHAPAA